VSTGSTVQAFAAVFVPHSLVAAQEYLVDYDHSQNHSTQAGATLFPGSAVVPPVAAVVWSFDFGFVHPMLENHPP
jgi:hypothetical protein